MPKPIRGLLVQLIVFVTIACFLSLQASCVYARQVFSQKYGIINRKQSADVKTDDMDIDFVIPADGGPAYHPVPSYPIKLLKEEREELNGLVSGFKEAGQGLSQIISFLEGETPLQEIVVSLCRNGFDIVDISFALGNMGYSKEEVANVLPVKIDSWGEKKSILVGVTTGDSSFVYYSTATPLPNINSVSNNISQIDSTQIDSENALDISIEVSQAIPNSPDIADRSCSDDLKQLQDKGKIGIETAVYLLEEGYSISEIVYAYVDMALDWAGDQTVNLINCAAFALAESLGSQPQIKADIDLENLATDIIYRDILMQGEVWIKEGKIQSSMAAIQETASSYDISLNAYSVDKEDILSNLTEPAIVHLKQGHWVVLKSVYGDKATIISDGKKVQISISGLRDMLSGNILSAETLEKGELINTSDLKQIRGSGWGKKFRKWRKKMSSKFKSFAKSALGKIITAIVGVVLAFVTAGTLAPMMTSVFGEALGAAIADGLGTFASTFTTASASGMKAKDALKTAAIAGITAGVASYASKTAAAESSKTATAAETAVDETAQAGTKEASKKQAVQEIIKEKTKKVTAQTIKQITSDTAKKKIAAYAVQEALVASGKANPYTNVLASAVSGGVNAGIDGGNVIENVVKSAAAQSVNETGSANEWHGQVSQLANVAVNSAADSMLDENKSSAIEVFKESFKATADSVRTDIMKKVDSVKKGFNKAYKITNQGLGFFKKSGEKISNSKIDLASVAQNITKQISEGFSLNKPKTWREYDKKTNTMNVDQDLNYFNLNNPDVILIGIIDLVTYGIFTKMRWGSAQSDAAKKYVLAVEQGVKGIALSGVNDDGKTLHNLVKELTRELGNDTTVTITHSAGAGVLLKADKTTDKVILISPQVSRQDLESWIDARGLQKEDVIVVDVKGDLPYAQDLTRNITSVASIGNGTSPLGEVLADVATNYDNAYNDYSSNPNDKYTYVRIEEGGNLGGNLFINHLEGVEGVFDGEGNMSNNKYRVSVNGVMKREEKTIIEWYKDLL